MRLKYIPQSVKILVLKSSYFRGRVLDYYETPFSLFLVPLLHSSLLGPSILCHPLCLVICSLLCFQNLCSSNTCLLAPNAGLIESSRTSYLLLGTHSCLLTLTP